MVQPIGDSKSPDKYTINKNLVVNLNDSNVKPVKRENSNTTNTTHVTGITATTAGTHNSKNNALYNTQYKGVGGKGTAGAAGSFFPSTNTSNVGRNAAANNYMTSDGASSNYDEMSQKL